MYVARKNVGCFGFGGCITILGVVLCILDFYQRNGFIWSLSPEKFAKYSNGIRHGGQIIVSDPDIRLGGNLICFPISHVYFFVGGPVYSQAGWGHGRISHLDPPLVVGLDIFVCYWKQWDDEAHASQRNPTEMH